MELTWHQRSLGLTSAVILTAGAQYNPGSGELHHAATRIDKNCSLVAEVLTIPEAQRSLTEAHPDIAGNTPLEIAVKHKSWGAFK